MLREGSIAVKVRLLPSSFDLSKGRISERDLSADYADYADSAGAQISSNAVAWFELVFNLRNLRNLRIGFAVSDFPVIVSG